MIYTDAPSPNYGPRAGGRRPDIIILHYTDTRTTFDALQILQSQERQVSAHYLVGDNGQVMRLVPEEMRAWHAGKSWWAGEGDLNSRSVGIEIQNPGHGFGYVPFPQVQMNAVAELCRDIIQRWRVLPYHVLAHSDIAPGRKIDPGELFPWAWLATQGVGLWPEPTDTELLDAEGLVKDEEQVKLLMTRFGYDPSQEFTTLVTAFQRHFEGDVFTNPDLVGKPSARTVARMMALVRQRLAARVKIT
jgi:N-acetylmuramoyl-L-alanine amidase